MPRESTLLTLQSFITHPWMSHDFSTRDIPLSCQTTFVRGPLLESGRYPNWNLTQNCRASHTSTLILIMASLVMFTSLPRQIPVQMSQIRRATGTLHETNYTRSRIYRSMNSNFSNTLPSIIKKHRFGWSAFSIHHLPKATFNARFAIRRLMTHTYAYLTFGVNRIVGI